MCKYVTDMSGRKFEVCATSHGRDYWKNRRNKSGRLSGASKRPKKAS